MNLLLCSSSAVHPYGYLEYCREDISDHFSSSNNLIFIPFARPEGLSHEEYSKKARAGFEKAGKTLRGIEEFDDKQDAVKNCDGIFIGGGNTFLLLKTIYEENLLEAIKQKVSSGTPYMGTSAGSNIACPNIKTTNDMPIVYPPSFDSFGFVPFNLNPHYLDPEPDSKHKGETRETRIKEYHFYNDNTVAGLREGSILKIKNKEVELLGSKTLRIFEKGKEAYELSNDDDLNFLMG